VLKGFWLGSTAKNILNPQRKQQAFFQPASSQQQAAATDFFRISLIKGWRMTVKRGTIAP